MKDGTKRLRTEGKPQKSRQVAPTGRSPAQRLPNAAPTRLCVVCRETKPTLELVQLKSLPVDMPAGGRSAYVCITHACLEKIHGKMMGRALRQGAPSLDGPMLCNVLRQLAQDRLLALLGLARRCNELVCGVDRVTDLGNELQGNTNWLCLVAADLSPRSLRKLPQAQVFLSSEVLAQATGLTNVGALGIRPGRLAMQAAYWFRVWYESGARAQPMSNRSPDTLHDETLILQGQPAQPPENGGFQEHGSGHETPTRD